MEPLTVVWDFNGTLLDDVGIGIESINALLARRELPQIANREAYHRVFRFPIIDYYADLGLDVSDYDTLAHEWVAEYLSRLPSAPLQPGAETLLARIAERGIPQIILSATEQTQLTRQVEDLGIAPYFNAVLGTGDIYAHSKIDRALSWREDNPGRVLLIGDTDHDVQTARALGAACVLVACGHQGHEKLEALGVPVVGRYEEILRYL